jgi:hypothetical protein
MDADGSNPSGATKLSNQNLEKMNHISLHNLVRFYPYESAHASDSFIITEDKDREWYKAIVKLLSFYEAKDYYNCTPNYFYVEMDNKITLQLDMNYFQLYITYWDNVVYLSSQYVEISKNPKYCTVKLKKESKKI